MKIAYKLMAVAMLVAGNTQALELMGSEYKGEGELGYVATGGNTDTQNISAKIGLLNDRASWRHTLGLEALSATDSNTTTAERYNASFKSDYKFTEHDYIFGLVNYDKDKFGGYDYRTSEAVGYGRRVLNNEAMQLDLEIGPGARQTKLLSGGSENEGILRGAGRYAWKISPAATFTQDLFTDIGEDVTITRSVTGLKADIAGNLAMKLTFTAKNTSEVPLGVKKTDTETAVTLVYGF